MAHRAGNAVLIERAVASVVRVQCSRENANRIVAAIAVAGEFHAFGAQQNVHALAIERRAEGVGVESLAPLVVGLLMAVAAVACIGKRAGRKKVVAFHRRIARERNAVLGEGKVVGFANLIGVRLAGSLFLSLRVFAGMRRAHTKHTGGHQQQDEGADGPGLALQHAWVPRQPNSARDGRLSTCDRSLVRAGMSRWDWGTGTASKSIVARRNAVQRESLPTQDEPEGADGFQRKMSLKE